MNNKLLSAMITDLKIIERNAALLHKQLENVLTTLGNAEDNWCGDCQTFIQSQHDCDNCAFCGTDESKKEQ